MAAKRRRCPVARLTPSEAANLRPAMRRIRPEAARLPPRGATRAHHAVHADGILVFARTPAQRAEHATQT